MNARAGWKLLLVMGLVVHTTVGATSEPGGNATQTAVSTVQGGSPASDPPRAAGEAESPSSYSGLGTKSISPALISKYVPTPLPADISRRVQNILDVRAPGAGMIAPGGKALYFTWKVTGVDQVWRVDQPLGFPIQLTGGEDPTRLEAITPDGAFLVVSRDRRGEENPGLYLQPAKGGALIPIQHKEGVQTFFQFVSEDSKTILYTANDVKPDAYAVYRYDIATGQRERIFSEDGLWSVGDEKNGRFLLTKATGNIFSEWYEWDPARKTLTPLMGQGEQQSYQVSYGANPDELIVMTPRFGDFKRLYRWRKGQFTAISPELRWDLSDFWMDRTRKRILYGINEGGYQRIACIDAKTFRPVPLPQLPKGDRITLGSQSRNGRFTVFGVESSQSPRVDYVYDWQNRKLTRWVLPSIPEIDARSLAPASLEAYPARDGTSIPMLVRRPSSCQGVCPVIVFFHGGPEGQSLPGLNLRAQLFVDAGFVVVEPNVRGSTGYGRKWLDADNGAKRLEVITDIEDCARYIRSNWGRDGVAPRIGILGGSYGGYSALIGMTMFAGAYDAGVSVVGISNLLTFLNNTAPYRRILRTTEYGDPVRDREALIKLSPTTYIDRVSAPLLIQQGVNDPRVPVGEAIQIHEALEARHTPSRLILFPDEGHGAQRRDNQVLQLGHALLFFKEHLMPPVPERVQGE